MKVKAFLLEPSVQFRTDSGAHYLTDKGAQLHRVRHARLNAPRVDRKSTVTVAQKSHWRIVDGRDEYLTADEAVVAAVEKCIASGWTASVAYCRDGGRLRILSVTTA